MSIESKVERLCDEAADACRAGEYEEALALAEEALTLLPDDPWALLAKAEALFGQDELEDEEEADETIAAAVRSSEGDVAVLLRAADVLLSRPVPYSSERALELLTKAGKAAAGEEDETLLRVDIARLRGRAFSMLDDLESSQRSFEEALTLAGDAADVELLAEVGIARFEMRRFDEAQAVLLRAEGSGEEDPDVQHYLGLIAERAGDGTLAARRFQRARRLDPDHYPTPFELSDAAFEEVVAEALAKVPAEVQRALENVAIIVQPLPELEDLAGPPALSPLSLGMFKGPVGPGAEAARVENALPSEIHLYQTNLQRYAASREDLVGEIEQTLMHEIGHFVGWDEEDLHSRGLH
jgi:predicted Zn-dependent protease with MMP-like domain